MKILLITVYVLSILAVVFLEHKRPTEALLWVLVLVCLPYVGLLLYLIFGSTLPIKLTALIRRRRLRQRHPELAEPRLPDLSQASEEDAQVIRFNAAYNRCELTSYEDLQIYTTGKDHYTQLFQDIAQAQSTIYVEFYTIHNDMVGQAFVEALTKKAREGIPVLVLCDFIANVSTPPKMFRPLRQAGGKVIRVKPFLTHYRSHRKLVVIDHRIAYVGGMNIGKQYADQAKVKTPWRDTQVRMVGPCARILDEYFLCDWLCSVPRREWEHSQTYVDQLPVRAPAEGGNRCQFIVGGVDTDMEGVKMCYHSLIRSAKHRIRIQTPYFIPDASILDALKTAAAAGVEIQLMIPGIKASFFLDPVTTWYCGQLQKYGARVYKYHGYVHAKTMTIDDELCCIGSVNMDMRSLEVDDEICGVFYENSFVKRYSSIYDRDLLSCDEYTYEQFCSRTAAERIAEDFFIMFAPLM